MIYIHAVYLILVGCALWICATETVHEPNANNVLRLAFVITMAGCLIVGQIRKRTPKEKQ